MRALVLLVSILMAQSVMAQPTDLAKKPVSAVNSYSMEATGDRQLVRSYASVSDDCRSDGPPQVELVRKPDHGTVKVIQTEMTVSANATKCPGETVQGVGVIFEPFVKAKGDPDVFVIKVKYRNGNDSTDTMRITAKRG